MKKIIPQLWYDREAKEAVNRYLETFNKSGMLTERVLSDTPSGDAEVYVFTLEGQLFGAINGGPFCKLNPSISLMVSCDTSEEVDRLYESLVEGGQVLMERNAYPFSKRYAWVEDRYGLSWQLMQTEAPEEQKISPNLLFSGKNCGKAEEAVRFYTDIFPDSVIDAISYYAPNEVPASEAKANYIGFSLNGYRMSAMDSGYSDGFDFNEAFSFEIVCDDQEEIDYYWEKLSADPSSEQCGWVVDRYGVRWQIVPRILDQMMAEGSEEQVKRVTKAFLPMKKLVIESLVEAYHQ